MGESAERYVRSGECEASPRIEEPRLLAAVQSLTAASMHAQFDGMAHFSLNAVAHELADYLYVKDLDGRFVFVNMATAKAHGFDNPDDMIGKSDIDILPADAAGEFSRIEREVLASGQPRRDMEETVPASDGGKPTYRLTSKMPLRNERHEIVGLIGTARDVSEARRKDKLWHGQAQLLEMIAKSEPLPMILEALVVLIEDQLCGVSGSVLLLDPEGLHLFHGAAPNLPAAYSKVIDGVAIGPNVGSCGTAAWRGTPVIVSDIRSDPLWEGCRRLALQFGLLSCWSTPITTSQGNVLGTFALYSAEVRTPKPVELELIAIATHIAGIAIERKRAEDHIFFVAHHDELTGLPNRAFFKEQMARTLFQARRNGRKVTFAYVDLDGFKEINDNRGHGAGDEMLKELSARMVECASASDLVVRLGGDEFLVVLVHQARHDSGVMSRLAALQQAITRPVQLGDASLAVTSSIGVATFPFDGSTPEELVSNADAALYRAKALGRNRLEYFTGTPKDAAAPLSQRDELRRAIAQGELFLEYQPQMGVGSGEIIGLEALVRWRHPQRGVVPPNDFIGMAEECGLIIPLGLFVLNEACRQNRLWQDMGLPSVTVAVNVSPRQFGDPAFADHVLEAITASGLDPRWLELELTESTLMQDVPRVLSVMGKLKAMGVRMSIDDFGTGYSSLSSLKTFPFHRLKMDRSLVEALPRDETGAAIASSVISLARKLKMAVIAEGVETREQLEFLRENHCDEVQGYYFSRPVAPATIETMLRGRI